MMDAADIIIISLGIFILLLCIFGWYSSRLDAMEQKDFCESKGGEYGLPRCFFKENGIYKGYNLKLINNKWRLVE